MNGLVSSWTSCLPCAEDDPPILSNRALARLKLKFGLAGAVLLPEITQIEDVALLQAIEDGIIEDGIEVANTPEELRQIYRQAG